MSRCGKFLSVGGEFVVQQVVELLRARPLMVLYNMSVAGVCVVEFGTYWHLSCGGIFNNHIIERLLLGMRVRKL